MLKDIKDVAVKYIERRERCSSEVKEYLKTKGYSRAEITEAMDFLMEYHYVDDERYCKSFVNYGMSKGKGPVRILEELKEKGISAYLIQNVLDKSFEGDKEKEMAMEQALKVICVCGDPSSDENNDDEYKEKGYDTREKELSKIGRRLSALGYSTGVILYVIDRLRKQ